MVSVPQIEKFLFTLSSGITGFSFLRDYGEVTPELQFFLSFFKEDNIPIYAIGPSIQIENSFQDITTAYNDLIKKIQYFDPKKISNEQISKTMEEIKKFHSLVSNIYGRTRVNILPF